MYKRAAGAVLSILLLITLCPLWAFAEEGGATGAGREEAQASCDIAQEMQVQAAATNVSPSGGKGSGTLSNTAKTKEFTVTLTGAGRLTIDVSAGLDLILYIYDGTTSSNSYERHFIDKGSEQLVYDLKAGTYTLEFRRQSLGTSGSFSFNTGFVSANETYTAENDTINAVRAGQAVPFGSFINGQMAWNDEEDYYKIVLSSSGRLSVNVHSDVEMIGICLNDPDNDDYEWLDRRMEKGDDSYRYDLSAGVYYLEFSRYSSNDTGTYSFKLSFAASGETYTGDNDSFNAVRNSAAVPLKKTIKGHIAYNDSDDYYKIVIPAKARYSFRVGSNISRVGFRLYDSKENAVQDASYYTYHSHDKGSKSYIYVLDPGTYYLIFERNSRYETGTYHFRINVSVPKPAIKSVSKGRKCFTVKWGKKSGITGYQIQYGTKSSFKGAKTVTVNKSKQSRKIKKLKAKRKYYVRMRAYRNLKGDTYYSSWSKSKTVKTR